MHKISPSRVQQPFRKSEQAFSDTIESSLALLASAHLQERKKAAKNLSAAFRRSYNRVSEAWAKRPQTVKMLVQGLNEPATHEASAIALGACIRFYLHGKRTARLMMPVLHSPSFLARAWAVEAVLWMEDEGIWDELFLLAEDPSSVVRGAVCNAIMSWINRGHTFYPAHREKALSIVQRAMNEKDLTVREIAMSAVKTLEK